MAHMSQLFIGQYASADDAAADYDSVVAAHGRGATGHIEAAVVVRDAAGELTLARHSKMGGMHIGKGPSTELKAGTQEVERGTVALLVVSDEDDVKAIDEAVTRAGTRASHEADHSYGGSSDFGLGETGSGSGFEGRLT